MPITSLLVDLSILGVGLIFYAVASKHLGCVLRAGLTVAMLMVLGIVIRDLVEMASMADVFFFQSFMGGL